jgi:hypothetical protein
VKGIPVAAFIEAACVPLDSGHSSGTLDRAQSVLAEHPEVASSNIHTAAILGDDEGVRRFLERDPAAATAKGGPRGWDALTRALAVKACVDSYWTERRIPESVEALLRAGASVGGVRFPSGYAEVDELLRSYQS